MAASSHRQSPPAWLYLRFRSRDDDRRRKGERRRPRESSRRRCRSRLECRSRLACRSRPEYRSRLRSRLPRPSRSLEERPSLCRGGTVSRARSSSVCDPDGEGCRGGSGTSITLFSDRRSVSCGVAQAAAACAKRKRYHESTRQTVDSTPPDIRAFNTQDSRLKGSGLGYNPQATGPREEGPALGRGINKSSRPGC